MPSLPNHGCLTHLLGSPHQATRSKTASPPPAFWASCPLLAFSLLALTTARYTTHRESCSSFTACLPRCITSSRVGRCLPCSLAVYTARTVPDMILCGRRVNDDSCFLNTYWVLNAVLSALPTQSLCVPLVMTPPPAPFLCQTSAAGPPAYRRWPLTAALRGNQGLAD